jgi:hypothetical protein
MYRSILIGSIAMTLSCNCLAQQQTPNIPGHPPGVPYAELKNTSDSGRCNKIKIRFKKAPDTDSIKICMRENKDGVPGEWYVHKSDPRANDADYSGLNESIDYDLRIQAINKYGTTYSPILTRQKCK